MLPAQISMVVECGPGVAKSRIFDKEHSYTSLGIYEGRPLAIGGNNNNNRYFETIFNDGLWKDLGNVYVGGTSRLYWYSTVTTNGFLYIFGMFKI